MSGRRNAAVPWIFVENIGVPHSDSSAPRMVIFRQTTADRYQLAEGGKKFYEADVRLVRGRGGGETPPAPILGASFIFMLVGRGGRRNAPRSHLALVAGFSLIQTQAWYKLSVNADRRGQTNMHYRELPFSTPSFSASPGPVRSPDRRTCEANGPPWRDPE